MEPLGLILGLPLAPLRGLIRLAELLEEQAEQELRSPAAVRRRLEELEEARASGEISEEEESAEAERILGDLLT